MEVVVLGAGGFVGSHLVALLSSAGHLVRAVGRSAHGPGAVALDLCAAGAAASLLQSVSREAPPDVVVNLAGVPDIAPCRADPELARALNARMPGELAQACAARGVRLVHVSTDQVFDGSRGGWRECDVPGPMHVYGETKLAGEHGVLAADPSAVVVRPGLVTGLAPAGRRSASSGLLAALRGAELGGRRPQMFSDEFRSPIAVQDLVVVLADLAVRRDVSGLLHAGGPERLSRHALALREAALRGFEASWLDTGTRAEAGLAQERPADLSLDSTRLHDALGWSPRGIVAD